MKYKLGISNPDELSNEEFASAYRDYLFLEEQEKKKLTVAIAEGVIIAWNKIHEN